MWYHWGMNSGMEMSDVEAMVQAVADLPAPAQIGVPPKSLEVDADADADAVGGELTETWASEYGFLKPVHGQVAQLLLEGVSRYGAAKRLGIAPNTVYILVNTPEFIKGFRAMQAELVESVGNQRTRIETLASKALDNIADILWNSGDADLKAKTSMAILDRAGHSVKQQVEMHHIVHIDSEAVDCIDAAFRELGIKEVLCVE